MHASRSAQRALRTSLPALSHRLSEHRAATRGSLAALALTLVLVLSPRPPTLASGPSISPASILPTVVGVGIRTDAGVGITFDQPMDAESVADLALLVPHQPYAMRWSPDGLRLGISPTALWRTDQRYLLTIPASARTADGSALGETRQFSFTTETAPVITDFQVRFEAAPPAAQPLVEADGGEPLAVVAAAPPDTVEDVSARTTISISFNAAMNRDEVERRLVISPAVEGVIAWRGTTLVFTPSVRLSPDERYAVTLAGVHDSGGNLLRGDASFSFTTRVGAQLVRTEPAAGSANVTARQVVIWFSQPMDAATTQAALRVTDISTQRLITGAAAWNAAGTRLTFTAAAALPAGHRIEVRLGSGTLDADGNPVLAAWWFTTRPIAVTLARAAPAPVPVPAGTSALQAYALSQINASRADYGFAPLSLDPAISAVAYTYAVDLATYGYLSHVGRDGSTTEDRLRAGGVQFGYSGENLCYYNGLDAQSVLQWCHRQFMAEAYPPPPYNHKSNILSPDYRRVGIGIYQLGSKIVVVWDFTD